MSRFKVSVLRGTAKQPALVEVTTIMADAFCYTADGAILFVTEEKRFLRASKVSVVAALPPSEWVIE